MAVPDEAVLKDFGNPVGDAVGCYTVSNETVFIRCFVPAGGA